MAAWRSLAAVLLTVLQPSQCQRPLLPTLPSPRFVILGATGAGKSSLANALLGFDPRCDDCLFEVCSTLESCTKNTTYGIGPWLGTGQNCTVVDTPGFGDSDNEDEQLIEDMMDILANTVDHADTLLLLLDGTDPRFKAGLQAMLKKMTVIFGQNWWDFVVIGVSFWAFDQDSIDGRWCDPEYPKYCKDEAWFKREITAQLNEKFHVDRNFTFVFIDSWSQTPGPPGYNTEDPLQQEHWQKETGILWDLTVNREDNFGFMTIDDILEENAQQRAEIKWLNDVITSNISKLNELVTKVKDDLIPGVGSIIAWTPGPQNSGGIVPDGWQRCDGTMIMTGIFAGQLTPALNSGAGLFLRGGHDSNANTIQEDAVQDHTHDSMLSDSGHAHAFSVSSSTSSDGSHTHDILTNGFDKYKNKEHRSRMDAGGYETAEYYDEWYNGKMQSAGSHSHSFSLSGNTKSHSSSVSITNGHISNQFHKAVETRPKNMAVVYIIRIY